MSMPTTASNMSASSSATEKTLARIRAGISLGLMQYEKIEELMKSNSGNVDDLRREASALAQALDLIDEQSKKLDPSDPGLIVPRKSLLLWHPRHRLERQ